MNPEKPKDEKLFQYLEKPAKANGKTKEI